MEIISPAQSYLIINIAKVTIGKNDISVKNVVALRPMANS